MSNDKGSGVQTVRIEPYVVRFVEKPGHLIVAACSKEQARERANLLQPELTVKSIGYV